MELVLIVALAILLLQLPPAVSRLPANQQTGLVDFNLPAGYLAERVFAPPVQFPSFVAISPSGVIVITDDVGDRVIQVHEDGTLTTYAAPSPNRHAAVAFDSAGNLFVVDRHRVLWKVTPSGVITQVASGVYPASLEVAPSGDIFATDWWLRGTDVQRITPDGQVSVYASGLPSADDIAVNPITGAVYVASDSSGEIYKVNPDGTVQLLTSGLTTDPNSIAFANDGTLYHMSTPTGLSIVSTTDGTRVEIAWFQDRIASLVPKTIALDNQGRVVCLDATFNHIVRLDLNTRTTEVLSYGIGNSNALAVAPDGDGIYLGVNHPFVDGKARLVRIEEDGTTATIVDGLPPVLHSMVLDADGVAYISAVQPEADWMRSTIYTTTLSGITGTLATLPTVAHSLAIEPTTGYLWGTGYQEIWYIDDTGARHTIPFTVSSGVDEDLAFTPDGTLYAQTTTSDPNVVPMERGIYRVDPDGPTFTLIADLSTVNICCQMGHLEAGRDGYLYWVGGGDRHTPGNEPDFYILRITPAGEVTLFGRHLPIDPSAITTSPDATDLYFSSARGVYRVFEANMIFLPLVPKK